MHRTAVLTALLVLKLSAQPVAASWSDLTLVKTIDLQTLTNHVQGIDSDGSSLFVTSVDSEKRKGYLRQFTMDGLLKRSVEIQMDSRFHPGGLSADGRALWIPVAEYQPKSSAVIQRRSMDSLDLEFSFTVPDHIGCIAATREELIGGNWDSKSFYVWDRRGALLRKVPSTTQNAYQDIKFDGTFLVASGLLADRTGAVDWLELPSFRLVRRLVAGKTDRGVPFTREGMGIRKGSLFFLPEDNSSRVFFFALPF